MIIVEAGTPDHPQARALLEQSHALMAQLFPVEGNHALSLEELRAPHVRFFVAHAGDGVLGVGALAVTPGQGEVKSLFTAPEARGRGVAAALLRRMEETARALSLPWLRLETGVGLDAAQRLYRAAGFVPCAPFGAYTAQPSSIFMEKAVGPDAQCPDAP